MFSIISVIPLGCNNDDPVEPQIKEAPVDPPQLTQDLLLWKIYSNGNLYKEINYDEASRIESIKEYENGQLVGSELWEYNKKGQVEKKWLLDSDGSFQVAYTYEFDNSGKLVKSLVYKELLKAPTYGTTYEYNDEEQVSSEYHFVPSQPDYIQSYVRYEYDVSGNLAAKKNYTVKASGPDVLYYEEYLLYDEPQKTVKIREKIEKPFYEMMYLYSSSTITSYENDGSGDIGYSYSVANEIDYNADGWPTKSNVNVIQTHPQHKKTSAVIGYEYLKK